MVGRNVASPRARSARREDGGRPRLRASRRREALRGALADFQTAALGVAPRRSGAGGPLTVRRAAHLFCPSEFLRVDRPLVGDRAGARVGPAERDAAAARACAPRDELRASFGVDGPALAFAGRLTRAKALDVVERRRRASSTGVTLLAGRRRRGACAELSGARASPLPRGTAARAGPRAARGRRARRPLVDLGELPARARRGARGRDAGDRDRGRRRAGDRATTA